MSGSLKITNEEILDVPTDAMALDAELINVYKGTHGVILVMDISKAWTWQYVQRELEKIPRRIPVLVLANFRDMGDHRVVQTDEVIAYIEHLERPSGSAEVYFSESSMKDGFGLGFVYKFLNMPFLLLQRESLLRQLEANNLEMDDTRENLSIDLMADEHNYGLFKDMLLERLNPTVLENTSTNPSPSEQRKEDSTPENNTAETIAPTPVEKSIPVNKVDPTPKQLPIATVPPTVHNVETPKPSKFQAYKAKLFGGDSAVKQEPPKNVTLSPDTDNDAVPIEEFNPGQLDDNFLSGGGDSKVNKKQSIGKHHDSSDDESEGNPMVAGYEDLSSEDDVDNDATFEQQLSVEADFDDLSDDERKELGEADSSFLEQIKPKKKKDKDVDVSDLIVSAKTLDVNDDYDDIESELVAHSESAVLENTKTTIKSDKIKTDNVLKNDSEINVTQLNISSNPSTENEELTTSKQPSVEQPSVDKSDEEDASVYVIAGDVDVEDDWMNNESDENESENESENENNINKEEDALSSTEPTSNTSSAAQDSSLNFDLNDLEMFMSSQLKNDTPKVPVEADNALEEEAPKPRKKKKKKVADASEGIEVTAEKKKKKKKPKKIVDSDETINVSTKPKTKKLKTVTEGTETTSHKKKKRTSTSSKTTSKSEYDAFFDL